MNESCLDRVIITIEELGELTQALSKYVRYINSDETLRNSKYEIEYMILEEIADVEICLSKLKNIMNIDEKQLNYIKDFKQERFEKLYTK
nr:MAG TPA: nucleoside triphosphate pyrophosphohydrolase [Podoviridae sp. ct1Pw90]